MTTESYCLITCLVGYRPKPNDKVNKGRFRTIFIPYKTFPYGYYYHHIFTFGGHQNDLVICFDKSFDVGVNKFSFTLKGNPDTTECNVQFHKYKNEIVLASYVLLQDCQCGTGYRGT